MADIMETHYIDLTIFRRLVKKGKIDLNDPKDRIMLLFDVKTSQNIINKVIKMDNFANEVYNKTLRILQDKKEYLAYIRAEQAELDRKGQIRYAKEEEKLEIALKLKKEGIPPELISKTTDIPLSEVKKL